MKKLRDIKLYGYVPNKYDHWLALEGIEEPKHYASLIDTANYEACITDLTNTFGARKSLVFDHGFILVHPWDKELIKYCEDIQRSLTNYPLLCDDTYNRLIQEQIEENIGYDLNQLKGELVLRLYDLDYECFEEVEIEATEEELFDLYYKALDNGATGYTDQGDGSVWLDIEDVAKHLSVVEILTGVEKVKLPNLDKMPHDLMHQLIKQHRTGFYNLEGDSLDYPDFIILQYDTKQGKLF